MNILTTLFSTSASVIALYAAILSILIGLEEKKKYIPSSAIRISIFSVIFLLITCIGSLISMLYLNHNTSICKSVIDILGGGFVVGILLMIYSLNNIIRRR